MIWMLHKDQIEIIRKKYHPLEPFLNERARRIWAAIEANLIGHGGVHGVSLATGLSRNTILAGVRELQTSQNSAVTRQRKPGGGRKKLTERDSMLKVRLEALVEPSTRGDPMSALRWTCKSKTNLANELTKQGHKVSASTVGRLLHDMDYSLQGLFKTKEGASNPDRNAQFEHINTSVTRFLEYGQPVISVDTKKKELVGEFKNGGREFQKAGCPIAVNGHDFPKDSDGKAIPYGVLDLGRNEGWVNIGVDRDTPRFAVESIRQWWETMGNMAYPKAKKLLITADSGGSNGYRPHAWKYNLQKFSDESQLEINVCHFPPGTSKWNKIEHRMFCHITQNWRGRPLVSHETIVNLIGNTTTSKGLRINAKLDTGSYPKGEKVSKIEKQKINIKPNKFHGEWNYRIIPTKTEKCSN